MHGFVLMYHIQSQYITMKFTVKTWQNVKKIQTICVLLHNIVLLLNGDEIVLKAIRENNRGTQQ